MTHPYLTDWRESQLATWRHTDLNPDHMETTHDHHSPAPSPAPVLQRPDPALRAAPQHARLGARRAAPRVSLDRAAAKAETANVGKPEAWINWNAATGKRSVSFDCESELASEPLYTADEIQNAVARERERAAAWCDHFAIALDYSNNAYVRSRECARAAIAIRAGEAKEPSDEAQ